MHFASRRLRIARVGRRLARESGATAIEVAFALPILLALTIGAFEMTRAVFAQSSLTHAAKETARFAAVRGAASGNSAATRQQLETMAVEITELPAARVTALVSWAPDNLPGGVVTIEMEHEFRPIALPFLPGSMMLSSTASMTIIR